jgi:hypothetical protein
MIAEVLSVDRLLWWAFGVLGFAYFAYRSVRPSLSEAWRLGELGTHQRREFLMYLTEYKDADLVIRRMFGSRIVFSALAVLAAGAAFTVYLRPEVAWVAGPGQLLSARFLLPLIVVCVVLLGELLLLGVLSAWDHGSQIIHFSDLQFASPERAAHRLEKRSWANPSVLAVITGLLVIGAALIL